MHAEGRCPEKQNIQGGCMPYVRVWIHLVWTTKNKTPLLRNEIRGNVFRHMRDNAAAKGIFLDCINGVADHVHALVSLRADMTIAKTVQLLKGEAAHWINQERVAPHRFEWQEEYYVASVSDRAVEIVRRYIKRQEEHHREKSWEEECRMLFGAGDGNTGSTS